MKLAFALSVALTCCLAINVLVAAKSSTVADFEDSRHLSHAADADTEIVNSGTSPDAVSTASAETRLMHDKHCKDSPFTLLLETVGGSMVPFKCRSMSKKKPQYTCTKTGVLPTHCPRVCGKCSLYGCSDSQGTFFMGKGYGNTRDCSWLQDSSAKIRRKECKKSSVAKTCRATCNFCGDTEKSNEPSAESSMVPSDAPSFRPSPPVGPSLSGQPTTWPAWNKIHHNLKGDSENLWFGISCAMSSDGFRIIVGAVGALNWAGQVRVYEDDGSKWAQVHASLNGGIPSGWLGISVGISADGLRITAGGSNHGQVRVFEDNGSAWLQIGQTIYAAAEGDSFGASISMSAGGSHVIIAAQYNDENGIDAGQVYVYQYKNGIGSTWEHVHQTKLYGEMTGDFFGSSVGISADGSRIIIGANKVTVDGMVAAGQVKVFQDSGSAWVQLGQDLNGSAEWDQIGGGVADITGNGKRIIISSSTKQAITILEYNESNWVQVHQAQVGYQAGISSDGSKVIIGKSDDAKVQVFKDNGSAWVQVGEDIKGGAVDDNLGSSVGISGDGSRIVAGAVGSSNFTGKIQVFEK